MNQIENLISLGTADIQNLINLCKSGFSTQTFDEVADDLQVPDLRLASIIRIPKSTLTRRKREGRFSFEESERLFRIARLFNMSTKVLGTKANAREWFHTPSKDFKGKAPLEFADTEIGAREVEAVLGRIADGVIF
jgi:putative toxin-antitoxin system antitoxin component (TIGR02293 family)